MKTMLIPLLFAASAALAQDARTETAEPVPARENHAAPHDTASDNTAPDADSYTTMMNIYNSPESAPQTAECNGNILCNAFVALAKQWQAIPATYRYQNSHDIRRQAAQGDGYGLHKGFILKTEQAIALQEAAEPVFFDGGAKSKAQESLYAQGLAVLLYLEDQNGQAN